MFNKKRNEYYKKKIDVLLTENKQLKDELKTLQSQLDSFKNIIDAALKYKDEHQKEMKLLAEAKTKYDIAYKDILKLKKEYKSKADLIIESLK